MGRLAINPLLDIHGPYPPGMRIINPYAYAAAGGPPTVVASTGTNNGASGADSCVSNAIDTSGSNFLVVSVGWFNGTGTLSDSKSNTWTPLTGQYNANGNTKNQLFYCYAPTVGPGHTFTFTGSGTYSAISVIGFNNIASSPFDVENGSNAGFSIASTVQTGSVTPSQANSVVIAGLVHENNGGGVVSIDSSFTAEVKNACGGQEGNAIAYKILSSATAQNPTWNVTNATSLAATIAVFKY